jgi:catechol 2,3-dioxygenase-like lactoylglutathione lyase family enzyme
MAKLKHIALSTQDVEKTAGFYMEVFGMKEIAKIDATGHAGRLPDRRRHQPRELNFKKDTAAGGGARQKGTGDSITSASKWTSTSLGRGPRSSARERRGDV